MEIAPHLEELRQQLLAAADSGDEDVRAAAERLALALDPAVRMVLLDALSGAAAEITRDLAPGAVDVRLRGRDVEFVVSRPPEDGRPAGVELSPTAATPPSPSPPPDDGGTARITLRLPDHLKGRIEDAAADDGLSVNAWLVRAVAAAIGGAPRPLTVDAPATSGGHLTGWAR